MFLHPSNLDVHDSWRNDSNTTLYTQIQHSVVPYILSLIFAPYLRSNPIYPEVLAIDLLTWKLKGR